MSAELKILLIEDTPGDAFLIKFYLGESISHKFDFSHVDTLEKAFTSLNENTYDIILMDLNLPDSVGLESVKKLIETFPNNLVIVLTGLIDERVGLEAVRFGAQDFLVKGIFDSIVLVSSIIFSYERYNLNKKLFKTATDLATGESRFNYMQEITGIGFVELDLTKSIVNLSDYTLSILGYPNEYKSLPLNTFFNKMFTNDEHKVFENFLANKEVKGEYNFTSVTFKQPVRVKWERRGDLVFGVVYYNELNLTATAN